LHGECAYNDSSFAGEAVFEPSPTASRALNTEKVVLGS